MGRHYTRAERRAHLRAWQRSGQSAAQYTSHAGMSVGRLLRWRSVESTTGMTGEASVPRPTRPSKQFIDLVPMTPLGAKPGPHSGQRIESAARPDWTMELQLPGGIILRLRSPQSPQSQLNS
jgi:hypothetical protein